MKAFALSLFLSAVAMAAGPNFHITGKIEVGGDGGWDYVTVDSATQRLFLSRATRVIVVDLKAGKVAGEIPDTPGVHGVALAHPFKKGFTSNGRENKVSVFDPATLQLIKKIDDTTLFRSTAFITTRHPSGYSPAITDRPTSQPLMPRLARLPVP